jgi:hypothetical protein
MLISPIDGKILHLKELDLIERTLYKVFSPDEFYSDLSEFLKKNFPDIPENKMLDKDQLKKVDSFIEQYFDNKIDISRAWILRAYVVGRLLEKSDTAGKVFDIANVANMPKTVLDAAKTYKLTIEEAKALEQALTDAASLMSNTQQNTIQTVRVQLTESIKGNAGESFYDKLRESCTSDMGELNRDWKRVAVTETNSAFNNGYLAMLKEGDYVVGISMPDACEHCLEDINGKVYRVRKEPPPDYTKMTGAEYQKWADVWENEVWVGKNNFGRSTSKQKRIVPTIGNKKDNLREKHHHEFCMPALPYHPDCHCRWIKINPKYQYVQDGTIKMRVQDEDEWENWYINNIGELPE